MRNPKAISQNKIALIMIIKKPFAFLRSVCDERTFSFYLVDLLKEYCFIE